MIGFEPLPIAITAISISSIYSEPSIGTGLLLPESSGSPSSIFISLVPLSHPFSSPTNSSGFASSKNSIPSSFA